MVRFSVMHTPDSLVDLLSTRARIGWAAPAPARPVQNALFEFGGGAPPPRPPSPSSPLARARAPARPVQKALFEFGGGFPDPASFPYDGLVDATARMMRVEGAEALTYGEPQ